MNNSETNWRSFSCVSSDAEAAAYADACVFSLATLEIGCLPGAGSFAVTERMQPDVWRWAVIDFFGRVIDAGSEPTQACAKCAACAALHLAMAESECLQAARR